MTQDNIDMPDASSDLTSDTPPKKRRFRLRYSLRSLMLFMLLVGSTTGLVTELAHDPWVIERKMSIIPKNVKDEGQNIIPADIPTAFFTAGGKYLITQRENFLIWDVASGKLLAEVADSLDVVREPGSRPEHRRLLLGEAKDGYRIWDTETMAFGTTFKPSEGVWSSWFLFGVDRSSYSSDGNYLVTLDHSETCLPFVWDTRTGEALGVLIGDVQVDVHLITEDPPLKFGDNWYVLLDPATERTTPIPNGHTGRILDAFFLPGGTQILTCSADGTARLWDARTMRSTRVLGGHDSPVVAAAVSPDGKRIVTQAQNGRTRIWDADTGKLFREWPPGTTVRKDFNHERGFILPIFSRDGRRILLTFPDVEAGMARTRLLDIETGKVLYARQLYGYSSPLLLPDNRRLAIIDMGIEIIDLRTGKTVAELDIGRDRNFGLVGEPGSPERRSDVRASIFSPDGNRAVVLDYDERAVIYRRTRPEWWWGVFWLPQLWAVVLLAPAFLWSLLRDFRRLMWVGS